MAPGTAQRRSCLCCGSQVASTLCQGQASDVPPVFLNFSFKAISSNGAKQIANVSGLTDSPVSDVLFQDVGGSNYEEGIRCRCLSLWLSHAVSRFFLTARLPRYPNARNHRGERKREGAIAFLEGQLAKRRAEARCSETLLQTIGCTAHPVDDLLRDKLGQLDPPTARDSVLGNIPSCLSKKTSQ